MAGCIFCGKSPLTNAHIFRRGWMDGLVPGAARFRNRHIRTEPGAEPHDKSWPAKQADVQVKAVCARCNDGWMDKLDHAAEDMFATAAAQGRDAVVASPIDRCTLARWCTLIAVLADQGQASPRVGSEVHAQLYAGDLPAGVRVWLVRTEPPVGDPDAPDAEIVIADMDLKNDEVSGYAYFVTFRVLHLIAQVFIPTKRTPEGIEFERRVNERLVRQLWPDLLATLIWPPDETLPWDDFNDFTQAFRYRSR
jgi:hypothetical protein